MRGSSKTSLPKGAKIPNHIAIIPDGHRRWAKARGLPTFEGHRRGFERAVKIAQSCFSLGIHTVSFWCFSTENWRRSREEVDYLMKIYKKLVEELLSVSLEYRARIIHLGRKDRIPKWLLETLNRAERETRENRKHILNIALDYGGHDEILRATRKMLKGKLRPEDLREEVYKEYLDTKGQPFPYPDLIIRTSGEQRLSGFMSWQNAYSEFYFEKDHFPDFTAEKLKKAILDYSKRERRFGGNSRKR